MIESSIGVFDSGIGGLTVVHELFEQLPNERIVYFGDTARVPYGSKSVEIIRRYASEDTELLLQYNPSLIVVACNTVSAVALDVVKATAGNIPVVGMIGPACLEAVATTTNGRIGIIGTQATVTSKAYDNGINAVALGKNIRTFSQACPLLVPLAEEGWQDHRATTLIVEAYLSPLKKAEVDTLILGCTHYPVLSTVIGNYMGPDVTLINSGAVAARNIKGYTTNTTNLSAEHLFLVSDVPSKFQSVGERFLGYKLPLTKQVIFKEAWVVV